MNTIDFFKLDQFLQLKVSTGPFSRYLPSLNTHKDWWVQSNVTWFLRRQTSDKICQYKKSRLCLFILDNRRWRNFILKTIMEKYGGRDRCYFFNTVVTVDVLTESHNDVNLVETSSWTIDFANLKLPPRFETYCQILTLFAPLSEIPRDIAFIPSILKRGQRCRVSWIRSYK